MRASRAAAVALALIGWLGAAETPLADDTVAVAVRRDAAPFSYRDVGEARYAGFMVDLCTRIVRDMGREPAYVAVTADARFVDDVTYDVLCDPTTVTPERARSGVFSPIVFVSGISFVFSATNNDALYRTWLAAGEAGRWSRASDGSDDLPWCRDLDERGRVVQTRIGVLAGTTAVPVVTGLLDPDASEEPLSVTGLSRNACLSRVESHAEGLDRLCGTGDDPPLSHYFADRDILSAQLRRRRAAGDACGLTLSRRFFSVEPYALFVRNPDPAFLRAFMASFYRVHRLGGPDGPRGLFERYFEGRRASDMVETIFFLNAAGGAVR